MILKKRPHKEAQTPDDGDLTMAQSLNDKSAGKEGNWSTEDKSVPGYI